MVINIVKLLYLRYIFLIRLKYNNKNSIFLQFELLVKTLKAFVFNIIFSIALAAVYYFMELCSIELALV